MRPRLVTETILCILLVIGCASITPAQSIVINEIQSANTKTFADEDGAYSDWIELYNAGSTAVNLLGYGLSDDLTLPFKWTFPSTVVQPNAYVIVFASDKNRLAGPYLHTNFSIKQGGEPILITKPDGVRADEVAGVSILTDQSFGRKPDGQSAFYFFTVPTPAQPNTTDGYQSALTPPTFSHSRGFYNASFSLTLSTTTSGAVIRYTTDGSDPTDTSPLYTSTIPIRTATNDCITGIVKDPSGNPIRNAVVQVNGYRGAATVTDDSGAYSLPLTSSPVQVFADALGYSYRKESLSYTGGLTHDIVLTPATETGVIVNGGFEQVSNGSPVGWSVWGGGADDHITVSTENKVSGNYAAKFTPASSGTWRWMCQEVPVTAGSTYNCYYKLKAEAGVPVIFPMFAFRNNNNDELQGWVSTEPGYMQWYHVPPTEWKQYLLHGLYSESLTPTPLVRIAPPAGATKMTIWFGVPGTAWGGSSLYVDDVVIDRVPAAASSSIEPTTAAEPATKTLDTAPQPAGTGDLFKATVVRAKCFKTGYASSPTVTHTYFVAPNATSRYTLPIVSLATDRKNFFDNEIGIYVPGSYDNYNQGGEGWERPVHVEFFEAGGPCGFQCDAGIRLHGGWTRNLPQKSLRLYADHQGGPGSFNYKLFSDSNITDYKRIILRNSGNDNEAGSPAYTLIRDGLMQELISSLDVDTQNYRPALMFFNGEYWGIHNIQEREDNCWIKNHHPTVDNNNLDLIQQVPGAYDISEGDSIALDALAAFIKNNDLTVASNYDYVKSQMDISNIIIHHLSHIFFANTDWPGNNIRFWRERSANGKWRWTICDTDFGFGLAATPNHNTLGFATARGGGGWPNPDASTVILASLLRNREFRDEFINRMADMLNTVFVPGTVVAKINSLSGAIAPEVAEHFARWGNVGNVNTWNSNIQGLRDFANQRPAYIRSDFVRFFHLTGTSNVTINVSNTAMGSVTINTVKIPSTAYPWQGTYFDDVPVKLTATPAAGYKFVGWQGAGLSNQNPATITLSGDTAITAVFEVN